MSNATQGQGEEVRRRILSDDQTRVPFPELELTFIDESTRLRIPNSDTFAV